MGCKRHDSRKYIASSEIVSYILVFSMISGFVGFVLLWGVPYIDGVKDEVCVSAVYNQLEKVDRGVHEIVKQGINCSQVFSVVTDRGYLSVDPDGLRIVIFFSVNKSFEYNITYIGKRNFTFQHLRPKGVPASLQFNATSLINDSKDQIKETVNNPSPIVSINFSNFVLSDAVKIDVVRPTFMSKRCEFLGSIYLFDVGYVKYSLPYGEGHEIVFENCGIHRGNNSLLFNQPELYIDDEHIVMRVVKLFPTEVISFGSFSKQQSVYNLKITVNSSNVYEINTLLPKYIKMLFFGETLSVWADNFMSYYGFRCWDSGGAPGRNDIYFLKASRKFSFSYSICSVDLDVRG